MTLDQALSIASTRTVDLWRLCVEEHAGWSPDPLRDTALDLVTREVERQQAECVRLQDALTFEHLRAFNAMSDLHTIRAALQNLVTKIDRSTTGPHAVSITDELAAAHAALINKETA